MLTFTQGQFQFGCRAAGITFHNGHILLHRSEVDDFWALPGGRVEEMETVQAALAREMREELNIEIVVGQLMFVVENFFPHNDMRYHELGLYFQFYLPEASPLLNTERQHHGIEGDTLKLIFQWFPINKLNELDIRPPFLSSELARSFDGIRHIVERRV